MVHHIYNLNQLEVLRYPIPKRIVGNFAGDDQPVLSGPHCVSNQDQFLIPIVKH